MAEDRLAGLRERHAGETAQRFRYGLPGLDLDTIVITTFVTRHGAPVRMLTEGFE